MKKILLLTLIFMLSFSSAAFGMTGANSAQKNVKNIATLSGERPASNLPERLVNPEKPDEKVRIIVELEKAPTIQKATEKGVLYKQLRSSEREGLEAAIVADQVDVQKEINKEAPSIDYLESFTTVFNGFSAEVEAQYVEKIANTDGVKAVYEATEYERPSAKPEMIYSKELVQAQKAWKDYGFKGEGMVVGIIDTGIDPSHKDMVLTKESTGEITKAEVEKLLADKDIDNGKYYTAKVPFGWNYMDKNDQILDLGPDASMHGMHVAGTVAANGNEENGGVQGVAPEAQLLALKVFGNDPLFPSTFGDIYIKAIDDSIKLGADVINMSLGSTAGFVDANNPEQQAVKRATENGVLVAISAGNSALFGDGSFYPYAENQDYGLTGSPSVSEKSLGVASFENAKVAGYSYKYEIDGKEAGRALYLLANNADPIDVFNGKLEIVEAGLGNPDDFKGKDLKGKIALVQRGVIGFVDKGKNAQAAGAAGVIIYNNAAGTINMASDPAIKIPYMFSLKSDGDKLAAAVKAGSKVTLEFDGQFTEIDNPTAGKMSAFTSWGPTPNLDFKPEITAPGGNIFSTLNNDKYGLMSGTSMAAPHVAGGSALVFERVDKEFKLTGSERVKLAKNLLMNTAKPVEFSKGEYVSPRRQGSGLMQLANALSTNVLVTNKATGEAKVALKEIKNNEITFTLEAKNYSDKEASYNVDVAVQVDNVANAGVLVTAPNLIGSEVVTEDVDIDTLDAIKVPAKGTATLDVTIDISSLDELKEVFTNGFFVDGFVTLTDANEAVTGNVPLTVPFFGFNGSWDDAPLFDYFAWDDMAYWGYTALADEKGTFMTGGGAFDTTRFGFSPNGDGSRDKAIPVFSLFRNAKAFKVQVVDEDGKVLRTIRTANNLAKHYIATNPYTFNSNYGWDGKIDGKLAEDGQYFIKLSGVIDFEGAEWQSIQFPVKVDTAAPTAEVKFAEDTKTISVANIKDSENGTGAEYWEVVVNGTSVSKKLPLGTASYAITNPLTNKDSVVVKVWDSAGNSAEYPFSVQSEKEEEHPVIYIETPGYFDAYDTNEVEVVGEVDDASKIKSVKVNGEDAQNFDGVNFSHTLTLEDGVQDVTVEAIDEFDTPMAITRKVFVDTQVPTIEVKNDYANVTFEDSVKVKVTLEDNFDDIRVYVNGDERFYNELSEPYAMNGFEKEIEVVLNLKDGDNEFVIEVEDLVGHKASQTVKIKKSDKPGETPDPGPGTPAPGPTTPAPPAGSVVVTDGDVASQINDANAKTVEVKVGAPTEAQPVSAQVSASVLKSVADSAKPFALKAGDTVVSVPSEILKAIAKDSPASVTFNVALVKDAKVPGKGTTASAVYDFSIAVSKDGKTTNVSTFSEPVSVTIPTTATVKDARKVAAYYLNGTKLEYVGGKYANGKVEFNTNHFSQFVVIENNKTFADVKNSFAQDAIEVLASRSITSGKSDTKFDPNGQITRAEFAVLIARALNLPTEDYKGTFKDVPKSKAWAYAGVEAAYRAGIVKGKSADTFAPDALITREEIAVMVVRAVEYQDANLLKGLDTSKKFADEAAIGTFAKDGVKKASALGIVSGRGGKFDPKSNATRAESAVMLYRALNKLGEF